jgi:hypothetical protein
MDAFLAEHGALMQLVVKRVKRLVVPLRTFARGPESTEAVV